MKLFKSIFKHKKGSQLVEKILMTAFAVAGGGAVVVYGSNVLTNAKNTEITGILSNGSGMTQEQLSAHFNDSAKTVTLSADELNSNSFSNLASAIAGLNSNDYQNYNYLQGSSITASGNTYAIDEIIPGEYVWYYCGNDSGYDIMIGDTYFYGNLHKSGIIFMTENSGTGNYYDFINATSSFTWNTNNEDFYELIKPALIADLS